VPSNEQRRLAAKRKLERQLVRRQQRAKRRRLLAVVFSVGGVIVVLGVVLLIVNLKSGSSTSSASSASSTTPPAAPPVTSKGACKFQTTPSHPAPNGRNVGMPDDPTTVTKTGTVDVTLKTSVGDIPITLNRGFAPCTVQSELHLIQSKFYNNTPCHRETAYAAPQPLFVLQCGDPTGVGNGGPGYTIPDEKPTGLQAAPTKTPPAAGQAVPVIYPAGTLAMANTGQPHSGGSQFFLVYKDSQLPATYAVFGRVNAAGKTVLDNIVAAGITPGTDPSTGQPSPTDGKPKIPVTILSASTTSAS
jgi:peptidyl-prolyl cis-trans isomerase B (cyclophilin B)